MDTQTDSALCADQVATDVHHQTNSEITVWSVIQGGSNMTGTNCDLFTHKLSRSYLNHLVHRTTRLGPVFLEGTVNAEHVCSSSVMYWKKHVNEMLLQ
jgi:hypothetical protein